MRTLILLASCATLGLAALDGALANGLQPPSPTPLAPAAAVPLPAKVKVVRPRWCPPYRYRLAFYPPTYMQDGRHHVYYPVPAYYSSARPLK